MSRLSALIGCAAAALVLGLESAEGCTCAPRDLQETLSRADAAFIGILTARRRGPEPPPSGPAQPMGPDIFTFRVDDVVKGRLGRSVDVWSPRLGASCGLEIGLGERIGLLLSRDGPRWTSGLCWQVSPASLSEAERRLPRPNGSGPVRFLVGGGFGAVRLLALDAGGRTLGYGAGTGPTKLLDVCPQGRRAVEVVDDDPERVAVRDVRTLSIIRETPLPTGNFAANVYCRDAAAENVYVFAKRQRGEPLGGPSVIFHLRASRIQERYVGSGDSTVFRRNFAYVNDGPGGRDIVRVDLQTGARRVLVSAPLRMNHLGLSPRGTSIAGVQSDALVPAPARLVVLTLDGSRPLRTTTLGLLAVPWLSAELTWLDEKRLAVFAGRRTGAVFDSRLRRLGSLKRWWASDTVVVSGSAYGLVAPVTPRGQAWLQTARLPNGASRRLRHFPGAGAAVIAAVPGEVIFRPRRSAFCLAIERVFPGA